MTTVGIFGTDPPRQTKSEQMPCREYLRECGLFMREGQAWPQDGTWRKYHPQHRRVRWRKEPSVGLFYSTEFCEAGIAMILCDPVERTGRDLLLLSVSQEQDSHSRQGVGGWQRYSSHWAHQLASPGVDLVRGLQVTCHP